MNADKLVPATGGGNVGPAEAREYLDALWQGGRVLGGSGICELAVDSHHSVPEYFYLSVDPGGPGNLDGPLDAEFFRGTVSVSAYSADGDLTRWELSETGHTFLDPSYSPETAGIARFLDELLARA